MKPPKILKACALINMKRGFNNLPDQCGDPRGGRAEFPFLERDGGV
jgi:hypothetical protein